MSVSRTPLNRFEGLPARSAQNALRGQQLIEQDENIAAAALLNAELAAQPRHPELLRLRALIEHREGRLAQAIALLRAAANERPDDALIQSNLGAVLAQSGDIAAASDALGRATSIDPTMIDAWFNLGRARDLSNDPTGALAALDAALAREPLHHPARILRAEILAALGRIAESESELRIVLRKDPSSVPAWVARVNLKSFRANADDARALERLYESNALAPAQRIDIGFAYASVLETEQKYARAFDVFSASNTAKRKMLHWDTAAVSALIDAILAAFATTPDADDSAHGANVVFLVGMPRSGSTLAEQILAAHPKARAGSETGFIARVLQGESKRRQLRFPQWVAQASAADWARIGAEYLARIATLRGNAAVFTDKTLSNWQTLGAIRRMLPGARIVHCLRDPLETAWSCYKHNFAADQLFSYDIAELAAFYRDSMRAMRIWKTRFPQWIYEHRHEALLAEPEASIRALLAHCGLEFDSACLDFHRVERDVRTASASQVREPLRADPQIARRYGALLDPLRRGLEERAED